ncbi:MAG: hypothetical protein OSB19_18150 [Opitutaceae bacterium]|nr:hypothetical protein [Opitutaceae bacterium]
MEALEAAVRSNQLAQEYNGVDSYLALMVQAIAHFRLGDTEKAKAIFAQAKAMPTTDLYTQEAREYVAEIAEGIMK